VIPVTEPRDDPGDPLQGSFREAVERLAGPGDVIRFDIPSAEQRGQIVVAPHQAGLRIEGPATLIARNNADLDIQAARWSRSVSPR
jgi:hypothetical protein